MQRSPRPRGPHAPAAASPAAARERALGAALRALARRPRSRSELAEALARRGHDETTVAEVLARVAELGYLDDALVADAVARDAARRHHGSRRVALTLGRRRVARDVAEAAARASASGDLERARALLARRYPSGVGASRDERRRAARLLHGRGFPGDVVREALGIDVDVAASDGAGGEDL